MGFSVTTDIIKSTKDFNSTMPKTAILTFKCKTYTILKLKTNNKNETEKEQTETFWEELDQLMNNIPANYIKVLLEAFNAHTDKE